MSDEEISLILYRLEKIEETLAMIHSEVKKTNGRVTQLEIVNAEYDGQQSIRRKQEMVLLTVLSGALLAGIVWFVQNAI